MVMLAGKAYIRVDGALLRTNPGATIDCGGHERSPVKSTWGLHGYSEMVKEATLECEFSVAAGEPIASYGEITNATIMFEADTGQRLVIREAWASEPVTATEGDGGQVSVKFMGQPAEEG